MTPVRRALGSAAMLALVACHARPPLATTPSSASNRPPSVRLRCEPCTVSAGQSVTIAAEATDPDGDALTYAWSAPSGRLTMASAAQTSWTAPAQDGPVPVAITVTDGKGGIATDAITIQVARAANAVSDAQPARSTPSNLAPLIH